MAADSRPPAQSASICVRGNATVSRSSHETCAASRICAQQPIGTLTRCAPKRGYYLAPSRSSLQAATHRCVSGVDALGQACCNPMASSTPTVERTLAIRGRISPTANSWSPAATLPHASSAITTL